MVIKVALVLNLAPCHYTCGRLTLALIATGLLHDAADLLVRKEPWQPLSRAWIIGIRNIMSAPRILIEWQNFCISGI
jgi:hypothetical protein